MVKRVRRPKSKQQRRYERKKQKARYGSNWDKIRHLVYKRDGYRCRACGKKNVKLNAHHVILLRVSKSNSSRNLITLCDECHVEVEQKGLRMLKEGKHRRDIVRMTYRFLAEKKARVNASKQIISESNK